MKGTSNLAIRELNPEDEPHFLLFLQILTLTGAGSNFHPHPFTRQAAEKICGKSKNKSLDDVYFGMFVGPVVVGYGFLRGFDDGHEIPSLGIAIHPDYQGKGLSKVMMAFLHSSAKLRGCKEIYLKVYKDNSVAVKLYKGLGYELKEINQLELAGKVRL